MKALLKNGECVEIDTTHLFHNQYNTTDDRRIFDKDIASITNDARWGKGRCNYCGAVVTRGEEEKHFAEMESKTCDGCFWQREEVVARDVKREMTRDGDTRTYTRTVTETVTHVCRYAEGGYGQRCDCSNKEHRRMGIDWFTPENTFFLRYPNGFTRADAVNELEARGFVIETHRLSAYYHKKLGSYTLTAYLRYEDGKPYELDYYHVHNARRDYNFRYCEGRLFTDKYHFGWEETKTLEGIPNDIMTLIKNICRDD